MATESNSSPLGAGIAPATTAARDPDHSERVVMRYQDAYRVAGFIVGMGTVIKIMAGITGFIILLAGLIAGGNNRQISDVSGLGGFLAGGLTFVLGFVAGVIVSALGQQIRASLDAAVYSSPFMDIAAKARAMGLGPDTSTQQMLSQPDREAIASVQTNWPGYS